MSNKFYFDDDSSESSTDLSSLPYPKPLTRASFLVPDFNPTTFLSSLHNRHQTLEDLRSELRQRSADLNKELLDLVNSNYEDFLGLGRDLRGGDEKVEELRLGVLGFKRELEGLKYKVRERRDEVERLVEERKRVRQRITLGKGLLEVERRVKGLEEKLMLAPGNGNNGDEQGSLTDSDEASEEEMEGGVDVSKLRRNAELYIYIEKLVRRFGAEHPFLAKQKERVRRLRQTVLLDLNNALVQSAAAGKQGILQILEVYKVMDASREAVYVLKEAKNRKSNF
ncbi:MAG: hypothetical protein Q9163_001153 [Psora crenata]